MLSQGVRACDWRRSRDIGLLRTHRQHILSAVSLKLVQVVAWVTDPRLTEPGTASSPLWVSPISELANRVTFSNSGPLGDCHALPAQAVTPDYPRKCGDKNSRKNEKCYLLF
jgi:hypothetical protein